MSNAIDYFALLAVSLCLGIAVWTFSKKSKDLRQAKSESSGKEWEHPDLAGGNYSTLYRFYEVESTFSEQSFILEDAKKKILGNFNKKPFGMGLIINNQNAIVKTYKPNETMPETGEICKEHRIIIDIQNGRNILAKVIHTDDQKGYEIKYGNINYKILFQQVGGIIKELLPAQFPAKIVIEDNCIGLIARSDSSKLIADFSNKILIAGINDIDTDILIICAIFSVVDFFPRKMLP